MKSSGNGTNQLFVVELDTIKNPQFSDINDNHVGIDVNSIVSINSHTAGYYASNGMFSPLKLASGQPMQVWVDYDGTSHNLSVSLAPYLEHKPQRPLLSSTVNLTSVLANNSFYVGFSSSTGLLKSRHYIIGWSFNTTGKAQPLNYTSLSQVIEDVRPKPQTRSHIPRAIIVPVVTISTVIVLVICVVLYALRKKARNNFEWEIEAGPPSFTYKELVSATKGFSDAMLLGEGGFGKVYKGMLQTSKQNVAIKRVSPESKQGMKEFISEIMILGHLRHRNLVQLLGYSRHRNELLLVYDYMPNGSLDKFLHSQDRQDLDWVYRFNIIKGVASGLFYLHEDWEKVVIHRDIKTSNVLLDGEMNARLGDFSLARLHNHENGTGAHITNIAGTQGYIAPELAMLGRATKATDVFAFGVLMLEVACGRHPIGVSYSGEQLLLKDCVRHTWERDSILATVDPRLEDYITEEVELVLKLGLLCSYSISSARPSMRLIMQYLGKDALFPDFQPSFPGRDEGFDQYISVENDGKRSTLS
ncbi:L-type lectin-domain containing receptor kinase SIT2-like [Triticum dicoccoides]|uniref:L-type lectin-domain containing receptor kinase SIT2-like n=1 Tax=Triticum dicoccoides TaxID=85692 RepID=UPI0018915BD8|nr:L-type lectin-domain containing receptor kinase SIT2-like [Triticum dicoccoides]